MLDLRNFRMALPCAMYEAKTLENVLNTTISEMSKLSQADQLITRRQIAGILADSGGTGNYSGYQGYHMNPEILSPLNRIALHCPKLMSKIFVLLGLDDSTPFSAVNYEIVIKLPVCVDQMKSFFQLGTNRNVPAKVRVLVALEAEKLPELLQEKNFRTEERLDLIFSLYHFHHLDHLASVICSSASNPQIYTEPLAYALQRNAQITNELLQIIVPFLILYWEDAEIDTDQKKSRGAKEMLIFVLEAIRTSDFDKSLTALAAVFTKRENRANYDRYPDLGTNKLFLDIMNWIEGHLTDTKQSNAAWSEYRRLREEKASRDIKPESNAVSRMLRFSTTTQTPPIPASVMNTALTDVRGQQPTRR